MCILSYLPPGAPVDWNGLFNGGLSNPDGHGWAIAADDKIILGKSLNLIEALEGFTKARDKYPDGPALFHSRWMTHGRVTLGNTHPFLVGGDHRTVVAHNGILPASAHPRGGDERSDTRLFAEDILPERYHRLDRLKVKNRLEQWCGRFNKLVILTVDPRYRSNAYLINEDAGVWDTETGLWHSNDAYLDVPRWESKAPAAGAKSAVESAAVFSENRCLFCWAPDVSPNGYCRTCNSCQECYEVFADCSCWNRQLVG